MHRVHNVGNKCQETLACLLHFNIYLLLTEFKGRTVNYGPRFSPSIYMYGPSVKRLGHNSKGKTRVHNLQYGPRNEVSKMFIISLYLKIERAKTKF